MTLKPGDRVQCWEYTRINPTKREIGKWIADARAGKWWMPKEGEPHNKLPVWENYPIVVLRVELSVVFVTSSQFPEPLRSEGVQVPISHVELMQTGYGLPEFDREESKVVPISNRRSRKTVAAGQGALL